jgi:hypothetical protein
MAFTDTKTGGQEVRRYFFENEYKKTPGLLKS